MSNTQNLQSQYNQYQQTIESLNEKLAQLDSDLNEHKVVLETLQGLPDERRCWRMVDSALIEMNCKEARSALESTIESMEKSTGNLSKESKSKQKEFIEWKQKNNVRIVGN